MLLGEVCTVQWWYSVPHLRIKQEKHSSLALCLWIELGSVWMRQNALCLGIELNWKSLRERERESLPSSFQRESLESRGRNTQKIHKILTKPKIPISKPKLKGRHLSCISLQTSKRIGFDGLVKGLGFLSLV